MELKKKIAKLLGRTNPEQTPKKTPINNRFFKMYNWMLALDLSAKEVQVFAFIHSYNSHGKGYCYKAEVLGGIFHTNAETMDIIMHKMTEKGFLFKDARGLFWCKEFKEKVTKNLLGL